MSETRFTFGPWTAQESGERWRVFAVEAVDESEIQHPVANCWRGPTSEADARLIAAGPDLYDQLVISTAMLRTLVPADLNVRETLAANEAALAKARGEAP